MRFTSFIWDYDGTLVDTYPVMAKAASAVLAEKGIMERADDLERLMRISMGHALRELQKAYPLDDAFLHGFLREKRLEWEEREAKPYAGVQDFCKAVTQNGGRNFILTHRGKSTHHFLQKFGLDKFFTDYVTADMDLPRKPDPTGIRYLAEKNGFAVEKALMIGDRELDILSGKNAGTKTCFFSEQGAACEAADYTIHHHEELYAIAEISEG